MGAQPRVVDNDRDEITVTFGGKELRGWSYKDESERRVKMLCAREFVEGWYQHSQLPKTSGRWEFRQGAEAMREMLARFVEQGGDAITAQSLRLNWNPAWGPDTGAPNHIVDAPDHGVMQALHERGLFDAPELLEHAADEIDCGRECESIWWESDTNASGCHTSERGEYCPNDLAETLRALAKASRTMKTESAS